MQATQTKPRPAPQEMIDEIVRLAKIRKHRLGASMVSGRPLSLSQALLVKSHLDHSPLRERNPVTGQPVAEPKEEPVTEPQQQLPPAYGALIAQIPDGRYATKSRTGTNDLDFWLIITVKTGASKGKRFIRRVLGGHSPEPVRSMEGRYAMVAILEIGLEKSQMIYADETGTCSSCGIELTDEESRRVGKGPVCRSK